MKQIRKFVAVITLVSLLSTASSAFAADDTLVEVFTDAFYGAAIGGLVGGAILVIAEKQPLKHLNYVAYGAASGILAGTAYGLVKSARAFAEVENGRVKVAFPTIIPELVVSPASGQTTVAWKTDLIRGTFN